jgi:AraC family transcriptional regulator, regulatory protein of adaptative response / methylphosphotriester-DNA alkyltransferase methyltransferase
MRRNATDPVDQQKWDAIIEGDESQDGRFFYAVRTTGVYCRPSCRSKLPLRKNVEFFDSAEEAEKRGFRPCKRCKPDLSEHDRANPLPDQLKKICDLYYDDRSRLSKELERLDIHQNRLIRLFHQKYHTTPTKYLNGLRVDKAAHLLLETDQSMLQIAAESGFGSVSSFYSSFKFKYGQTPIEYRKNRLKAP